MTTGCTCDAFVDDPCPVHGAAMTAQDARLAHDEFWRLARLLVDNGHEIAVRPCFTRSRQLAMSVSVDGVPVEGAVFRGLPVRAGAVDDDLLDLETMELRDPADQREVYAQGVSGDPPLMDLLKRLGRS